MPSLTLNYGDNTGGTSIKMTYCVVLTTNAQSHTNIEGVIPPYSRIDNVSISLQWKTSLSTSKGDCRIYADANTEDYNKTGEKKVEPLSQASNGYTTLSVNKNNTILTTTKKLPDFFLSKSEFSGRYVGTSGLCIWFSALVARKWYWKSLKMVIDYTLPTVTISLQKNGEGTVSGAGTYEYGKTATITATPASGYTFVKWLDGSTSRTRTISVNRDLIYNFSSSKTYTAVFEPIPDTTPPEIVSVNITPNPANCNQGLVVAVKVTDSR